jgi:HEAT repeat protein
MDIHRCQAAQALGRIGDSAAVEPLIAALLDEDEDVRVDAAVALGQIADSRAVGPLLENLAGDPCGEVKLAVVQGLARLRASEAVPWLRRLAVARDESIAWDDSAYYADGWDDWVDIQVAAVNALGDMAVGEAVPDIVAAIDDEDGQDLSETGFNALSRMGPSGINALTGYLDSGDERRRRRAAVALAAVDEPAAQAIVAGLLRDPSQEVRLAVARALAGHAPGDERLAILFADADADLRAEAVRLCGSHHPDRLIERLDDGSETVQCAVLDVLPDAYASIGNDALPEMLQAKISESPPMVAAAAVRALVEIAPERARGLLAARLADTATAPDVRLAAVRGLTVTGGDAATPAFIGVLGDDERQIRLEAMAGLLEIAKAAEEWPNAAGDALLAALRGELLPEPDEAALDTDPEEAAAGPDDTVPAAEVPDETEDDAAEAAFPVSTLESILGDNDASAASLPGPDETVELTNEDMERLALTVRYPTKKVVPVTPQVAPYQDVRRFGARLLGDLARPDVADALAAVMDEDDRDLRLAAADSLARIGDGLGGLSSETVAALSAAFANTDRDLRLAIIRALGRSDDGGVAGMLIRCLKDEDSFIRLEAVGALATLGGADSDIQPLLQDADPSVRSAAALAIADTGDADAADRLIAFAFEFGGYHRREAARLLRRADAEAANRRFVAVLDDPEQQPVWQIAIEALEELNRVDLTADAGAAT